MRRKARKRPGRRLGRLALLLASLTVLAGVAVALATSLDGSAGSGPEAASQLTPGQLAGQRIVAGFPGTRAPAALRRMIRSGVVAGVILFADNVPSRTAAERLVDGLEAIPRPPGLRDPLLVMTDQEGGLVKRLGGAPFASAAAMGARGPAYSRAQGRLTGLSLGEVGINVDLAPVLDVARPGGTIAESGRGFASTPAEVAATAVPFAAGLEAAGVAAAGKHFPGLGAAALNTDDAVQRIPLSRAALRRTDQAPYRRFVASGGALVMLSTAIYPAFSPRPAAFARSIASGELRGRLGFEGVSITDSLDAASVRAFGGPVRSGIAAVRAGADLLLYPDYRDAARARRALRRRLGAAPLPRAQFERSVNRVLRLRRLLGSRSRSAAQSTGTAASDSQR